MKSSRAKCAKEPPSWPRRRNKSFHLRQIQPKLLEIHLTMYSEAVMIIRKIGLTLVTLLVAAPLWPAALGTSARSVIPGEVQQIISVDYRQVSQAPVAESLRDKILPDNLKQFETALRGVAIDPEKDIDQLTFVSFRDGSQLRFVGLAQGQFPLKKVFARLK